jgi:hypothetical protein
MKSPISDIKVLSPGDKLIIQVKDPDLMGNIQGTVAAIEQFAKSENIALALAPGFDVYILKPGAKILLRDYMNRKIKAAAKDPK